MKKVFKFVKGKKEEKREGGVTPSQSADAISPAQTPDDEKFSGLDGSSATGYVVDFSGKDKSLTKLHKAAWQGNLEKLKSALKKVDVDAVDKRNRTALHFAVAQGHPNIVWFLLGNNASVSICDDEGHTPLFKAIECGHKECANLLLERGADVNTTDCVGNSGLHVAVGQGSFDAVSALLKKGANAEIANNAGDFPLHVATRMENTEIVDLLLNSRASVDVLDRENRTPLMLAAKTGNLLLVRLFLERGAQTTIVDCNGWTALDYAMLGGYEEVAALLKSLSKKADKKNRIQEDESDLASIEEDTRKEESLREFTDDKIEELFEKCTEEDANSGEKERTEDFADSPEADAIPPFCQPPRSWEMIQAGMIDGKENGNEPKRRSITTLGTLHSRRESFTENFSSSPRFTLSLNRRKTAKGSKEFAKQRFSFNEEESLKYWLNEEKLIRKDLEQIELENMLNLEDVTGPKSTSSRSPPVSDWDSVSGENSQEREKFTHLDLEESHEDACELSSGTETLGREGTMRGVEEVLVMNSGVRAGEGPGKRRPNSWDSEDAGSEKEENFPPPPSALELGVDMAKSIKYMKGLSVDQTLEGTMDRNTWKNFYESHSLDCLEERDFVEASKGSDFKTSRKTESVPAKKTEEACNCQKPKDRFTDVSKRINEQLECYDQALRELAESEKTPPQNYHSLPNPSVKSGAAGDGRRRNSQELTRPSHLEPHSLPLPATGGSDSSPPTVSKAAVADVGEKPEKKSKRQMLLAMRDIKHAVHLAGTFKTSMDDHILSPLTNPELNFELEEKGGSKDSEGCSPPDENPFFGVERQETVLDRNEMGRKSSSSGTGEESTLWLQDEAKKKDGGGAMSDDEVPEILADEGPEHLRSASFSPLGEIQREMEEESRGRERRRSFGGHDLLPGGENEEVYREQSPDVSLSSGPLEPIGADKDSGSDPESSHNEPSPAHRFSLKSQHEWLKSHLKAATSEKSKLEELTVQLSEKAERLQYELADAKEAAKSRDEVIRLLQGQLARMEAAYTKSLEESVQSRLQLTSHEQEILHLKELCYRYEEEKEIHSSAAGGPDDGLYQELQSRVKALEEDKEKLKKELLRLEEEKCMLEKRIKQGKKEEEDMIEQCERWKERCKKLEDLLQAKNSERSVSESRAKEKGRDFEEVENRLREENLKLEQKCLEAREDNIELKSRVERLVAELEAERKKVKSHRETLEVVAELKKKNSQLEFQLREKEREIEEKMVRKLKEKEEEVGSLVKQFNRERDSLIASYERKLTEGRSEEDLAECRKENLSLRRMVKSLQEKVFQEHPNVSAEGDSSFEKAELGSEVLIEEMMQLKRKLGELEKEIAKEKGENGSEVKSEIRELKVEVNSLRELVGCESGRRRRGAGREDELAWSSLYGMKASGRRRDARSASVVPAVDGEEFFNQRKKLKTSEQNILLRESEETGERGETNGRIEKLEFLELKKEILSLQSKMSDEKNLRHALENQMIKLNLDLSEKGNLEREINSLKKRVEREGLRRSELELVEFQKHLEAKRERYMEDQDNSKKELSSEEYKTKCEILARERDKSKKMRDNFGRRAKSFDPPLSDETFVPPRTSQPPIYLHQRFLPLDPDMKNRLEDELNKSIRKYVGGSSSAPSMSNVQIDFVNKKYF